MIRTKDAAERLACRRGFFDEIEREFPRQFSVQVGQLFGSNGGLAWHEEFIRKMEILAQNGIKGMPAVRVAAVSRLIEDRLTLA